MYYTLADVWNHEMNENFAIDGAMRSLSPSFKNYVGDYVMGRDLITFYEFESRLRHVKVEPISREVDKCRKYLVIYKL